MTLERKDGMGTAFGLWFRKQPEIDSSKGYNNSDADYFWEDFHNGDWMIIEEKTFKASMSFAQNKIFKKVHNSICSPQYKGFHLLIFEKTDPEDGRMWLDGKEINVCALIKFLQFKLPDSYYSNGYFEKISKGGQDELY